VGDSSPSALAGKRVVVTRAVQQSEGLFDLLRARGAEPILFPLIRIRPIDNFALVDAALRKLRTGDWIVFTSQNAVEPVVERARLLRGDFFRGVGVQIAAIGPATEQALKNAGLDVTYAAKDHDGVSLALELGERIRDRAVLLPRSDLASTELPAALQARAANVVEVIAYRTEHALELEAQLAEMIRAEAVDAIVCFSPSAVKSLAALISKSNIAAVQKCVAYAAIGETTARAFREAGVRSPLVAADTTPEAVANILQDYFANIATEAERKFAGAKKS
jgi:uroporphyrinogen III methyltransferase/synthase